MDRLLKYPEIKRKSYCGCYKLQAKISSSVFLPAKENRQSGPFGLLSVKTNYSKSYSTLDLLLLIKKSGIMKKVFLILQFAFSILVCATENSYVRLLPDLGHGYLVLDKSSN